MPRYRVTGASRKTGDELAVFIDADDTAHAETIAIDAGILVAGASRIEPEPRDHDEPTLIERTHKKWKAGMLVGLGMIAISLVGCAADPVGGWLYLLCGAIMFIGCRIAAWWHTG